MQTELQDLAPKLAQANVETAELIKRIELDTVDVEKVKAVVSVEEAVANEAAMAAKAIKVGWDMLRQGYVILRQL